VAFSFDVFSRLTILSHLFLASSIAPIIILPFCGVTILPVAVLHYRNLLLFYRIIVEGKIQG
jgi:hypothetical protein